MVILEEPVNQQLKNASAAATHCNV
ncbi:hypothetical protein CRE_32634 [Caenorhabditis remanei]|uniref:Uncharacterized protein n=1 Tax=Caenorhabditis remanei TaxID=31234 RepID=E3LFZ7_CAERE|nr:hypothetical protein CRE_32634 [Caenorhabditis remanei]